MQTYQTTSMRPRRYKPIFGTPLAHSGGSLRNGLVFAAPCNEGGGMRMENLVDRIAGTVPTSAKFVPDGIDVGAGGAGVTFALPMPGTVNLGAGPFSFAALVRPSSGFSTSGGLAARNDGNSVGAGWQIPCSTNGTGLTIERTTTDFDALTSASPTVGRNTWVVVTYQGDLVAANTRVYFNGLAQTLSTMTNGTGTQPSDAANNFLLGASVFTHLGIGGGKFVGIVLAAYAWRRALLAGEVLRLGSDPYPFFDPLARVQPFVGAGGAVSGGFPALFLDL